MATVTVKSTQNDGRVAFFERDPAHPKGSAFVRGNQQVAVVGDTRALRDAIRKGQLVEVAQTAPVTKQQTPPTVTAPWAGYDEAKAEDIVVRVGELDDAGKAAVLAYEQSKGSRARKSIVDAATPKTS